MTTQTMRKRMWLTKQETLRFVKEYVKHKVLLVSGFESETKSYKTLRNSALSTLSRKMNIAGFGPIEAYQKLRNIRSTYGQELKKMRNAAARGSQYVSNLLWFKPLDKALQTLNEKDNLFVRTSYNIEAQLTSTVSYPTTSMPKEESTDCPIKLEFFEEGEEEDDVCKSETEEYIDDHINPPKKIIVHVPTIAEAQNNELITGITVNANIDSSKDINSYIAPDRNEFDVFAESIAVQLKNMPLKDALEAQMYIQSYLSSLRLKSLRGY